MYFCNVMIEYDVTIGIPVYQVEELIGRTMQSVLAQIYPSIEFLVLDDGCTDKSMEIVRWLQSTHPRGKDIRIVTHACNLGVSEARNRIIDEACGKYLYFMDSDDVINENTIALLFRHIQAFDADVVFGSYEKILPSGERIAYRYPQLSFEHEDEFANYAYRKYAGIQASACNYLVKMSVLRDNGLRFFKSNFWEDTVFTLELCTCVRRVVLLPEVTYSYIVRENSLSNNQNQSQITKADILQYFEAIETLKRNNGKIAMKAYYPNRCYIALMSDFYIMCNVLKKRKSLGFEIGDKELMSYMSHPATISEIWSFKVLRLQNLFFYMLGRLPYACGMTLIRVLAKIKGLI